LKSRRRWRRRLGEILDLPQDITLDLPRVTVLGDLQVLVENHRGVIRYAPEEVVIAMSGGRVAVRGRDLGLTVISSSGVTITGLVDAVRFERFP